MGVFASTRWPAAGFWLMTAPTGVGRTGGWVEFVPGMLGMITGVSFTGASFNPACVIASAATWKVCPVKSGITMPPVVCSFGAATSRLTLGRSTPAASAGILCNHCSGCSGGPGHFGGRSPVPALRDGWQLVATRCCSPVTLGMATR